jgi:hypothetical protein
LDGQLFPAADGVINLPFGGDNPNNWAVDIVWNIGEALSIDKSELQALVDQANGLAQWPNVNWIPGGNPAFEFVPNYTEASWNALQAALAAALPVLNQYGGSQAAIDAAAANLKAALDGLVTMLGKAAIWMPSVQGTVKVGETLTVGWLYVWPNNDAPVPKADFTYSYQWYRGSLPIAGATGQSYVVQSADGNQQLWATMTVSGERFVSTTVETNKVTAPDIIRIITGPSLPATANVGGTVNLTLTYTPSSAAAAIKWYRDGVEIAGATGMSYVLKEADSGAAITAGVTLTAAGMDTVTATSNVCQVSGPRPPAINSNVLAPAGTQRVGTVETLTYTYQPSDAMVLIEWLVGGASVQTGGTTYTLKTADVGKSLQVRVTVMSMPFAPVVGYSNAVAVIA